MCGEKYGADSVASALNTHAPPCRPVLPHACTLEQLLPHRPPARVHFIYESRAYGAYSTILILSPAYYSPNSAAHGDVVRSAFGQSAPDVPLVFILTPGCDAPMEAVRALAAEQRVRLESVCMGQGQGKAASRLIADAARTGGWVFLANAHLLPGWLTSTLERVVESHASAAAAAAEVAAAAAAVQSASDAGAGVQSGPSAGARAPTTTSSMMQAGGGGTSSPAPRPVYSAHSTSGNTSNFNGGATPPHPSFRLWVSSTSTPAFPVGLLQRAVKVTTEAPRGLRAHMLRLLGGIPDAVYATRAAATPNRYPRLLTALAWTHAVLVERSAFRTLAWSSPVGFSGGDFAIAHDLIADYLGMTAGQHSAGTLIGTICIHIPYRLHRAQVH